jgi:predicted nucleic acid-binding Zn ribbon protein
MAECFVCGAAIPKGGGIRKRVYTGSSVGGFNLFNSVVLSWLANSMISRRRPSVRSYYSFRTVCSSCAVAIDGWERKKRLAIIALLGVFLLVALYTILDH